MNPTATTKSPSPTQATARGAVGLAAAVPPTTKQKTVTVTFTASNGNYSWSYDPGDKTVDTDPVKKFVYTLSPTPGWTYEKAVFQNGASDWFTFNKGDAIPSDPYTLTNVNLWITALSDTSLEFTIQNSLTGSSRDNINITLWVTNGTSDTGSDPQVVLKPS